MEEKCCKTVWTAGAMKKERFIWHSRPCSRKAKVERDGRFYCGIHDPVRIKRIDTAKWDRRELINKKHKLLEELGILMIRVVANNGNVILVADDASKKVAEYNDILNKFEVNQEV